MNHFIVIYEKKFILKLLRQCNEFLIYNLLVAILSFYCSALLSLFSSVPKKHSKQIQLQE